ncbi:hypothetical protein D3C78_1060010 [compost metagenome]
MKQVFALALYAQNINAVTLAEASLLHELINQLGIRRKQHLGNAVLSRGEALCSGLASLQLASQMVEQLQPAAFGKSLHLLKASVDIQNILILHDRLRSGNFLSQGFEERIFVGGSSSHLNNMYLIFV